MLTSKEIIHIARETLELEAEVLQNLATSVDEDFSNSVLSIFESKGRVVLTGIGKSALVAQKISATLNSTGTPALFMHAADAIHGDLGMIQENDTIICISKSGESPEIRVLIPFVRNLGNRIIAMVSNKDSFLGKNADLLLWTPVEKEADPNNLAPTSSTTAQMAMGDALAVGLLALRGFSPRDFARYHPGGALGKQLYLKVADLARDNAKPTVQVHTGIRAIILEISSKRMGATAVVGSSDEVLGIITDGDLRRMLEGEQEVSSAKASDIMTKSPFCIDESALAVEALGIMRENSISQLIVTGSKGYVGMVHIHDMIREGLI